MNQEEARERIRELSEQIVEHSVIASKNAEKLQSNFDGEGVEEIFVDVAKEAVENSSDKGEAATIAMVVHAQGKSMGMEAAVEFGVQVLQQIEEGE